MMNRFQLINAIDELLDSAAKDGPDYQQYVIDMLNIRRRELSIHLDCNRLHADMQTTQERRKKLKIISAKFTASCVALGAPDSNEPVVVVRVSDLQNNIRAAAAAQQPVAPSAAPANSAADAADAAVALTNLTEVTKKRKAPEVASGSVAK